jgi:hypothetical protein
MERAAPRPSRTWLIIIGVLVAGPIALYGIFCWLIWGYAFLPPSSARVTSRLERLDRFTWYSSEEFRRSGAEALRNRATVATVWAGNDPSGCLAWHLVHSGRVPGSAAPVPDAYLVRALAALDSARFLERTDRFGPWCTSGSLALGVGHGADSVLVVGLRGQDLFGDEYPYCEAALRLEPNGSMHLLVAQSYRFDEAGIEGVTPMAMLILTLNGAFLAVLIWAARNLWRWLLRARRS